jgi:hypothetical protein
VPCRRKAIADRPITLPTPDSEEPDFLDSTRRQLPGVHASAACDKLDHSIAVLTSRLDSYETSVFHARVDTESRGELRADIRDAIRPGVSRATARRELAVLSRRLGRLNPAFARFVGHARRDARSWNPGEHLR